MSYIAFSDVFHDECLVLVLYLDVRDHRAFIFEQVVVVIIQGKLKRFNELASVQVGWAECTLSVQLGFVREEDEQLHIVSVQQPECLEILSDKLALIGDDCDEKHMIAHIFGIILRL